MLHLGSSEFLNLMVMPMNHWPEAGFYLRFVILDEHDLCPVVGGGVCLSGVLNPVPVTVL